MTGDILLLAGDISAISAMTTTQASLLGLGIGESQGGALLHGQTMSSTNIMMWRHCLDGWLLEVRPNVFSHYNGIARIGDTDIILSTLWSRIPLEDAYFTEQVISDFRRILYKVS